MARAIKAAAAKPAAVEEESEFEAWAESLMEKEPSQANLNFVEWVDENIGYAADPKTVQIVISQYQKFQKSPEQQAFNAARKEAAAKAAEERETRAANRETSDAAPARRTRTAKAAATEEADEAPAATTRGRRARVAAAPAAPVAKRSAGRRRPAAAAAAEEDLD